MRFQSKTEAYLYALYVMEKIQEEIGARPALTEAVKSIKALLSNHEQDHQESCQLIDSLIHCGEMRKPHQAILTHIKTCLEGSAYKQSIKEKYFNPLGRRLESQLMIEFVSSPTEKMMSTIAGISKVILDFLDHYPDDYEKIRFLESLTHEAHTAMAFGAWTKQPSLQFVRRMLIANQPSDFVRIMFIHFKFARDTARYLDIGKKYKRCAEKADYISNDLMYNSMFYEERGRFGDLMDFYSRRMGIVREYPEGKYSASLPFHDSVWIPDALGQMANLTSHFTRDLIQNDTPYVAGASGMSSMFIGCYLGYLGGVTTIEETRLYVAAFLAYIVSGGFHSIHEVLGPIAYCLKEVCILPDYEVSVPHPRRCAEPPNYDCFYQLLIAIDEDISYVLDSAWKKMTTFFQEEYLPSQAHLSAYHELQEMFSALEAERDASDKSMTPLARKHRGLVRAKPLDRLRIKNQINHHPFFQQLNPEPKSEQKNVEAEKATDEHVKKRIVTSWV